MAESYNLLLLGENAARVQLLKEVLLAHLPSASITIGEAASLDAETLGSARAAVVDVGPAAPVALDAFRMVRARGFVGPITLVVDEPDDQAVQRAINAFGNAVCIARDAVTDAPGRLAEAVAGPPAECGEASSPVLQELSRTRRLIAAGEMVLRLQHDINNPLAGLLAEVQLLQLDELTPEQRAATSRMLELCRRIVALVRRLDALVDQPGASKV